MDTPPAQTPRPESATPGSQRLQIEGLRAIAIVMVLLAHFVPQISSPPLGPMGVRFFFVLSGFLATRSLARKAQPRPSAPQIWRLSIAFWRGRFLRIAPVYFAGIAFSAVYDVPPVRRILAWLALFATNIYMAVSGQWAGAVSHLWYLAVDAQFFLLWPLVVFALPVRYHRLAAMALICAGIGSRAIFLEIDANKFVRWFSLPSNLDSLGMGALLAWAERSHPRPLEAATRSPAGLATMAVLALSLFAFRDPLEYAASHLGPVSETIECFLYALVIAGAWYGFRGLFGRTLASRPAAFLGSISFPLYVFHSPVNLLLGSACVAAGWHWERGHPAAVLAASAAAILVAVAASRFIEQPVERLRRH